MPDRVPVILHPDGYGLWLGGGPPDVDFVKVMLRPYPAGETDTCPVSTLVNDPHHKGRS